MTLPDELYKELDNLSARLNRLESVDNPALPLVCKSRLTLPEAAKTITGASNESPIIITITGHGYSTGDRVHIEGVLGNTAANGLFSITYITADTFSLDSSGGNDDYISGGTCCKIPPVNYVDVIGATRVYLAPYIGGMAEKYIDLTNVQTASTVNGSAYITVENASQLIVGMKLSGTGVGSGAVISEINDNVITASVVSTADGSTTLTSVVPAGTALDIFFEKSNLLMVAWTDATTRAIELSYRMGLAYLSTNANAYYCGSVYVYADGLTSSNGGERFVWNYYNQLPLLLECSIPNTYSQTSDSFLNADSNSTNGQGRLAYISGVAGKNYINLLWSVDTINSSTGGTYARIINSLSTVLDLKRVGNTQRKVIVCSYNGYPSIGYDHIQKQVANVGSDTSSFNYDGAGDKMNGFIMG